MFLAAPAAAQPAGLGATIGAFLPMLFVFVIFYIIVLRPQQQQAKDRKKMLESLKKGDKVITTGGIHGEITDVKEDYVTLKVAEKVELRVARSGISQVRK